MKKTILILLIPLLAGCASVSRRSGMPTDLENSNLNGPVKTITETSVDMLNSTGPMPEGAYDTLTEIRYNTAGNMTLLETSNGPGAPGIVRDEYEYDPTGKIITNSVSFKSSNRTYKEYMYKYDRRGRVIEETDHNNSYTIYNKYNSLGQIRQRRTAFNDPSGEPVADTTRYKYSQGKLRKVTEGSRSRTYHYASGGQLSEIRYSDGQKDRFDTHGNLIEMTMPVVVQPQGEKEGYTIVTSISAVYEYDPRGNWIKRTQYYEGRPINVTTRTIEYYGDIQQMQ